MTKPSTYLYGIGRRKTATATVKLFAGKGDSTINGKPFAAYLARPDLHEAVLKALKTLKKKDDFHFEAEASGSGNSAQAQALGLAIARALVKGDEGARKSLRDVGALTRDARKVERKKPGLHGARKAHQWSKR